jgi:hypothetical protein
MSIKRILSLHNTEKRIKNTRKSHGKKIITLKSTMNRIDDIRTPRKKTMITKNKKKTKVSRERILTMKSIRKKTINTSA